MIDEIDYIDIEFTPISMYLTGQFTFTVLSNSSSNDCSVSGQQTIWSIDITSFGRESGLIYDFSVLSGYYFNQDSLYFDFDSVYLDEDSTIDSVYLKTDSLELSEQSLVIVQSVCTISSSLTLTGDAQIQVQESAKIDITSSTQISDSKLKSIGDFDGELELTHSDRSSLIMSSLEGNIFLSASEFTVSDNTVITLYGMSINTDVSINIDGILEFSDDSHSAIDLISTDIIISSSGSIISRSQLSDEGLGNGDDELGGGGTYYGAGSIPTEPISFATSQLYTLTASVMGSGGGGALLGLGGSGGGAVRIVSSGTFQFDGSIDVSGDSGSCVMYFLSPRCGGGGSGGSVRIINGTISGLGSITAAGGDAAALDSVHSGAGGGGVVVFDTTVSSHQDLGIQVSVTGGIGFSDAAGNSGDGLIGSLELDFSPCKFYQSQIPGTLICEIKTATKIIGIVASGMIFVFVLFCIVRLVQKCTRGSTYNPADLAKVRLSNKPIRESLKLGKRLTSMGDDSQFSNFQVLSVDLDSLALIESVGQGAFGQVFRGTYKGAVVCIKKMAADMRMERQCKSVMQECLLLARLRHPNVLRLYGLHFTEQEVLLVTEFAQHGTLEDFVQAHFNKNASPTRDYLSSVLVYLAQICGALSHLHNQQPPVVHRDVKCANILLRDRETAVLADFGISRTIETYDATQTATVAGSPAFMAPECMQGRVSTSSDVYSIGVCLFFCVMGRRPFAGITNSLVLIQRIMRDGRPDQLTEPIWDALPRVRGIVEVCWRDPRRRPSAMMMSRSLLRLAGQISARNPRRR
eukprot:gnl/Dysnectes_brevis/4114_a5413_349.p1 GENE.gnl/Dysnectes_brevis/4114_a5413_349~~gnl/Dysnectes_brevis/4114_a5413_349.p1  ORF type:complete len:835 (-),score=53.68 gnl/Dysnectes_brevis/4114_a5413_349:55-2466(-)